MDIEAKIWNFSGTGTKVHAFSGGHALCRKSIARPAGSDMDFCQAEQAFKFSVCTSCKTKFNAAIERLENSMQPSTGEGDYLPPAEVKTVTREAIAAMRADTSRTEGSKYSTPEYRAMMADITKESDKAKGITREYVIQEETVTEPVTTKRAMVKPEISNKVIEALRTLRLESLKWFDQDAQDALNVLDNAGVFRAIDEASGYDIDPAPAPVSKCTCIKRTFPIAVKNHSAGCPGDPAEWGDMAYTTATAAQNVRLTEEHAAQLAERRAKAKQTKRETTARWQRAVGLKD